jgi:hypothetical protein
MGTDNRPEVKITMTKDFGKVLAAVHNIKISGSPNFMSAIQIAQVEIFGTSLMDVVGS